MTRRRVLLLPVLLLVAGLVYLFPPTQLSSLYSFDDWAPLGSPSAQVRRAQEIHGLLYFVINREDKILVPLSDDLDAPIDPTKPIELRVYGEDGGLESASTRDWTERANALDRDTPLVIFSKVKISTSSQDFYTDSFCRRIARGFPAFCGILILFNVSNADIRAEQKRYLPPTTCRPHRQLSRLTNVVRPNAVGPRIPHTPHV